ncbi:iron ABC transporter permease [Alkaliphilus pronyensis]|uniref:Iron ABC transporter permease n=1 Tax=Alkaliphilus pronyensis TaxID=1482732 RepID=A0A6I0F6R9_9FIRM|nr:iron ABC transporter permease [Alkaliphilus pronyensis]KAB3533459.1 iron ABC transporter permease [Alkaliphilus pronyensis]
MVKNKIVATVAALAILLIALLINICYGGSTVGLKDVIDVFIGNPVKDSTMIIVKEVRLPRAITGLMVGATLAASGTLIKAVMRNPLADSGLLGIQSGSALVAIFIILVAPNLYSYLPVGAFIGGIITYLILIVLAVKDGKIQSLRLVLAGVAISAFMGSMIGLITIYNSDELESAISWLNGSFVGIGGYDAKLLTIYGVIALIVSLFLIPKCNLLLLDDSTIENLGENVSLVRFIVATVAVFLSAVSVAFVGIVGFVGLVIPHVGKLIIGQNHKWLLPFSTLLGSIFVLLSDGIQKLVFSPMEIPVGIVISFAGAPFFLYLLRKEV